MINRPTAMARLRRATKARHNFYLIIASAASRLQEPCHAKKINTHSGISGSLRKPRNRRFADVVALRQFLECFALPPPPPRFLLLPRRELRWAAHVLPARLRPAAAFRRAGADHTAK